MTPYDRIVIGGGAAGLFCAGFAARRGERVLILEKQERPARKILITGKGRCNVTNDCGEEEFLRAVRRNPRFLIPAIHAFPPREAMAVFEELGVPLKTERGRRVFPVSDRASDIADALWRFVRREGAELRRGTAESVLTEGGSVRGVRTADGRVYEAPAAVIATGGMSYPSTGSDGGGYRLAAELGHTIVTPKPSLTDIRCRDGCGMFAALEGLSLKNVGLVLRSKKTGKKVYGDIGELLFTRRGVSGPLALTASSYLTESPTGFSLSIDLKPGLSPEQLDRRLLRDFRAGINRDFQKTVGGLLPRRLIPVLIARSGIGPKRKTNSVTREERLRFGGLLKAFTLEVGSLGPIGEAVVTAGGVSTAEIDPRTMASRLVPGLRFAGEVMDVDAETGGFNLQIAWSTGYLAARPDRRALF